MTLSNGGFTVGGKSTYADFGLYLASKSCPPPAPNNITKSVAYQDGDWDFTTVYDGAAHYPMRDLSYTFDIAEDTPEATEAAVLAFVDWCATIRAADLYDDDRAGYHYASVRYTSVSQSWNEAGDQCEVTVSFKAAPYAVKNSNSTWRGF